MGKVLYMRNRNKYQTAPTVSLGKTAKESDDNQTVAHHVKKREMGQTMCVSKSKFV